MDVILDDALAAQRDRPEPFCVILTAAVLQRVVQAADWVHADGSIRGWDRARERPIFETEARDYWARIGHGFDVIN